MLPSLFPGRIAPQVLHYSASGCHLSSIPPAPSSAAISGAGTLPQRHGFIEAPIGRQGDSIIGRCVTPNGKYSLTEYTVLAETDRYTLCVCR